MEMKRQNKFLYTFFFAVLLTGLSSCQRNNGTAEQLSTEVAAVSTQIQQTIETDWTPIPTSTLPVTQPSTATKEPAVFTHTPSVTPTETKQPPADETEQPPAAETKPEQPVKSGTATPDTRPLAEHWQIWPVLPTLTDNARNIFRKGVEEFGTDPHVFSKIGDCQSHPNVFLGIYDMGYEGLLADEDLYLQDAINYFQGSFSIESLAVHDGMSVSSVLTTTWADPAVCEPNENALDCELRLHNPSIMFINLGTNWISGLEMDVYYDYLSEIVEILIERGVLPILSSKADNVEGGNRINQVTAQVARDYDIPFFNFWKSAQGLNNHGLAQDNPIYLSVSAWNWRNYQALKLLYEAGKSLDLF